jgi:hypothetical protein
MSVPETMRLGRNNVASTRIREKYVHLTRGDQSTAYDSRLVLVSNNEVRSTFVYAIS